MLIVRQFAEAMTEMSFQDGSHGGFCECSDTETEAQSESSRFDAKSKSSRHGCPTFRRPLPTFVHAAPQCGLIEVFCFQLVDRCRCPTASTQLGRGSYNEAFTKFQGDQVDDCVNVRCKAHEELGDFLQASH